MITIASVLRSGGLYSPEWVQRLAAGVDRHHPGPYRFVCLSDVLVANVECIMLPPTTQPGWWSKMMLFRPGVLHGRILYFDLDSVLVGDLSDLSAFDGQFGMIGDFFRPELAQSGVMAWDADGPLPRLAWERFAADPGLAMARFHGDGDFLADTLGGFEQRLDRLYLGQIVSWKVNCRGTVPAGARVIAFHGSRKPCHLDPSHPVAREWRGECLR